jgi:hypothetical protein
LLTGFNCGSENNLNCSSDAMTTLCGPGPGVSWNSNGILFCINAKERRKLIKKIKIN